MRIKVNVQTEIDFQPSNLRLTNQYYAKYEAISKILDENPKIVEAVHDELKSPLKYAMTNGGDGRRHKYTSDQVLRILVCQAMEGVSLRTIIIRIDDGNYLRRFARIYNGPMMDFTTLDKLKNSIRPEVWRTMNRLLAQYAVQMELVTGEKLRLDTTAVETNIHWPTDSTLLWDTYRVLARLIRRARKLDLEAVGPKRLHLRYAKRLQTKVSRKAGKGKSAWVLKPLYRRLLGMVGDASAWAGDVAEELRNSARMHKYGPVEEEIAKVLMKELDHYLGLGRRVIDQARRRVLEEEAVPNDEKLFSIFEPHTELLKRGKAGKSVEFGHMIQIQQVREKFITDYDVFEKKPVEHQLLKQALESHRRLFGEYPDELGADKGYYESVNAREKLERKIKVVSIGKKGKRTPEQTEQENDPAFRHVQRFRAGIEGTISFLKRVFRLSRCFNKGLDHFVATIGATVFSHNLLILSRC